MIWTDIPKNSWLRLAYRTRILLKGSGNFVLDPLEIILDLAHAAMVIINL